MQPRSLSARLAEARTGIRAGIWTTHANGIADNRMQGNVVILPKALADDFRRDEIVDEPTDVTRYWRRTRVSFVLGCSFSFERDVQKTVAVIKRIYHQAIACLIVEHVLEGIMPTADKITVLGL